MRSIHVILLIYTVAILFHAIAADIREKEELAKSQQNDDDTSLFRVVENIIDEDSEDDAYRILKSLKDVRDDNEDEGINGDDDSDIVFDEDEEQDEDDFSADLPEFKNEETSEFFEHLPQQPIDNGDNKLSIVEDNIDIEEVDDILDELAPKHDNEEEDDDEEDDDEDQEPENSTPSPVLPPIVNEHIPWQRPEPVAKGDSNSNFYQDINYKESEILKKPTYTSSVQFWHLFFILLILAIVYSSITKRKPKNLIESTSSSSLLWNRKDEKDYLPVFTQQQ
ncbi:hypothetical protein [Parasitella parasitica]|uniref:Uncharacterized protein n=1 Tax=Parasitella parasitica TaxID=35722 RepID=A0A0B7NEU1_9FUNG|nr:hypothetical protein [Parasitella parasitica]